MIAAVIRQLVASMPVENTDGVSLDGFERADNKSIFNALVGLVLNRIYFVADGGTCWLDFFDFIYIFRYHLLESASVRRFQHILLLLWAHQHGAQARESCIKFLVASRQNRSVGLFMLVLFQEGQPAVVRNNLEE